MQQRQLRLGDILDDYCPRERRLTNHAVVAMIGDEVKQTRCTTCDAEHEFKHARLPRQRRKTEAAALAAPVFAAPKKVVHDPASQPAAAAPDDGPLDSIEMPSEGEPPSLAAAPPPADDVDRDDRDEPAHHDEGPVHRQLIRAQLPRLDGQPPTSRPAPDFTIRQPAGRQTRFRPRGQQRGGGQFLGNRSNGNVARDPRGGNHQRSTSGGRPMNARPGQRQGQHGGRKRSK